MIWLLTRSPAWFIRERSQWINHLCFRYMIWRGVKLHIDAILTDFCVPYLVDNSRFIDEEDGDTP